MKIFYEDVPLSEFVVVAGKSYEAAEFLAEYLGRAVGAVIEVDEASVAGRHEIRVGVANSNVNRRLRFAGIANGGFIIKFALGNVLIRADSTEGEMNGAVEFLERYAGWRFYPGREVCVGSGDVVLRERGGFSVVPAFALRGINAGGAWMERNHLNYGSRESVKVDFVGETALDCGISAKNFLDSATVEKTAGEIGGILDYNPGCCAVEVECPAWDGDVLVDFVNRVGDIVKDDYPEVWVEICVNPAGVSLPERCLTRDNVGVKLVLSGGKNGADEICVGERKYVTEWAGITARLEVEYVLDYVVDYHAVAEDFRFFAENHVYGVYVKFCGEVDSMTAYILARVMWNPYLSHSGIDGLTGEMLNLG